MHNEVISGGIAVASRSCILAASSTSLNATVNGLLQQGLRAMDVALYPRPHATRPRCVICPRPWWSQGSYARPGPGGGVLNAGRILVVYGGQSAATRA